MNADATGPPFLSSSGAFGSALPEDILSLVISKCDLKVFFRVSLTCKTVMKTWIWKMLTSIGEFWSDDTDTKIPLDGLLKMASKQDLLVNVRTLYIKHEVEYNEWESIWLVNLVTALAPRLEHFGLADSWEQSKILQAFFENCDSTKIKTLELPDHRECLFSLAASGLPNLIDLNLHLYKSLSDFDAFIQLLATKSGSLRRVTIQMPPHAVLRADSYDMTPSFRQIIAANPEIKHFHLIANGGTTEEFDCRFFDPQRELTPFDWSQFPSKLVQHLGITMDKFFINGNTLWATFYTKSRFPEFVFAGPDAAQFLWDACKQDDQNPEKTMQIISKCFSFVNIMASGEPEQPVIDFSRWLFEKMRKFLAGTIPDITHLDLYGSLLNVGLLAEDRASILRQIQDAVRSSAKHPVVLLALTEPAERDEVDFRVKALQTCLNADTLSCIQVARDDGEEEATVLRYLLMKYVKPIVNNQHFDAKRCRLSFSNGLLIERLLFTLFEIPVHHDAVPLGRLLVKIMDGNGIKLNLKGLKHLGVHVSEMFHDKEFFDRLCNVLDDYTPLDPYWDKSGLSSLGSDILVLMDKVRQRRGEPGLTRQEIERLRAEKHIWDTKNLFNGANI